METGYADATTAALDPDTPMRRGLVGFGSATGSEYTAIEAAWAGAK
jgi:hypothetical protein